jgi:phosphatidylglycerol:prolipoprotein diacylglycerol transferase
MDPILVQLGPITVRWYGLMMAVTMLAGLFAAYRLGPRFGVAPAMVDRLSLPFILLAFLGARLGYVLSHPAEFADLVEVLRVDRGGLTSHGAIAGGLLALALAARRSGARFWDLADTVVWVVPLGNIFVRFGNFMNGELYGDPTTLPWGVTFPGVPAPRHPLPLYEMAFAAIILAVALPRAARRRFPGEPFWLVLTLTSIGRILLDLLRSEDRVLGVLTLGMIPAALIAAAGGWILLTRGRASAGPGRPAARTP